MNKLIDLLTPSIRQYQEIENALYSLLNRLDIDNMFKKQLENIADLVGQPSRSLNEDSLRALIRAQIGKNISQGNFEDISSILKLLTNSNSVFIREVFPMELELFVDNTSFIIPATDVLTFMESVVACGVRIEKIAETQGEGFFRLGKNGLVPGFDETQAGLNQGKLAGPLVRG